MRDSEGILLGVSEETRETHWGQELFRGVLGRPLGTRRGVLGRPSSDSERCFRVPRESLRVPWRLGQWKQSVG